MDKVGFQSLKQNFFGISDANALRAIASSVKVVYFAQKEKKKKTFFLFYMSTFTKHPYQFIYSKHLFVKIFIILHFFIISFTLLSRALSLTASLSHTQRNPKSPTTSHHHRSMINPRPPSAHPTTINEINHHHQPTYPPSPSTIIK